MSERLRHLRPADLDAEQRELYQDILGVRGVGPQLFSLVAENGGLNGPFNAMLRAPGVGGPLQSLGQELRFRSTLSPRIREVVTLLTARRWNSEYEWEAHRRIAQAVGVPDAAIEAIRQGERPALDEDAELSAAYVLASAVLGDETLSDRAYAGIVGRLGERQVVELTVLVGYYTTLAFLLRVFDVPFTS